MKIINKLILALLIFYISTSFSQTHKMFSDILSDHVRNGLVNYQRLQSDSRLNNYLHSLSTTNPSNLEKTDELVFWINAYNAFTLKVVLDNYPLKSITEIKTSSDKVKTVWDEEFISINDKKYSLNDIEHKILREKFKEPRIHFAIVCASLSCPELLNESFESENIKEKLNQQASRFLSDKSRNDFNLQTRTAYLSKLFDWYKTDFGKNDEEVLLYLSNFLSDEIKKDIIKNSGSWTISYKNYDWSLNEIK